MRYRRLLVFRDRAARGSGASRCAVPGTCGAPAGRRVTRLPVRQRTAEARRLTGRSTRVDRSCRRSSRTCATASGRWPRRPGYTAVAVLTLALGVGANAAIFSVLQAVVLRDLPYHEPDRIAVMWTRNIRQNLPDGSSYLNFRDWKAQSRQFEAMAAYVRPEFTRGTLGGTGRGPHPGRRWSATASSSCSARRRCSAARSRAPTSTPTPRAVVISHGLWQQRFGGDPGVVGRSVQLDDATVEIVGVMPREFELPTADVAALAAALVRSPSEEEAGSRAARRPGRARPAGAHGHASRRRAPRWTPSPPACASATRPPTPPSASPPTRWSIASSARPRSARCGCCSARSGSCC